MSGGWDVVLGFGMVVVIFSDGFMVGGEWVCCFGF